MGSAVRNEGELIWMQNWAGEAHGKIFKKGKKNSVSHPVSQISVCIHHVRRVSQQWFDVYTARKNRFCPFALVFSLESNATKDFYFFWDTSLLPSFLLLLQNLVNFLEKFTPKIKPPFLDVDHRISLRIILDAK